jgi:hypothetical protein
MAVHHPLAKTKSKAKKVILMLHLNNLENLECYAFERLFQRFF